MNLCNRNAEVSVLAREAIHEAGHAVMARWLGLGLKMVRIYQFEVSGRTCVLWPDTEAGDRRKMDLKILAAARTCLESFGIDTCHDEGGFRDEAQILTILHEMFPDDEDGQARDDYDAKLHCEVARLFEQPNFHAAARDLAEILTRTSEIDGPQAEGLIDRHLRGTFCNERYAL